jgi:ABC-type sugar transport system substrate-binding protein
MRFPLFRRASWLFVAVFGLALAGATLMNLILISQTRQALDEGILGNKAGGASFRYHLGLVIPDSTDSFFEGLRRGVTEAANRADVAVQVFLYHANVPDEAETYFQLCLTSRLDGVILYTGADGRMAARGAQALSEDVVFIPVGTQVPPGAGQGFIGSSSLLQGVESGNQLTQRLGKAARVGLLLTSDGETEPQDDPVYQGVSVALQSYPGARIVRAARARPGILSGEEAASALFKAEPTINVLVCASAPITEGAVQVVVDQGRVGQILIIGTDRSPTIDRLVDKGVIAASIVRDSTKMGAEALKAFLSARGGAPFRNAVEVGFTVRGRQEAAK